MYFCNLCLNVLKFPYKFSINMKKNIILLFITLIATNYAFSQEVIIKDQIVTFNQKEILKAEKINSTQYSFYSIHTNDEILHFKAFDNETPKILR